MLKSLQINFHKSKQKRQHLEGHAAFLLRFVEINLKKAFYVFKLLN